MVSNIVNNKVLIVDDEEVLIESIRKDISEKRFNIFSAVNGEDGLEKYRKEKPVLILLDLRMPGMDGIEFLENMKLKPTDPCVVIILTGHGNEEEIKKCFNLGATSYIRKPYNIDVLKETVKSSIKLKQIQQGLIRKIDANQLTEMLLREKEYRFRKLAENVSEVFRVFSIDYSHLIYVSPAYEAVWGRTCESLYECPAEWTDSVYPEDREKVIKGREKLLKSNAEVVVEYRIIKPCGSICWILERIFLIQEPSSATKYIVAISEDTTRRKKTDEMQLKLSIAVKQSPASIVITDVHGNIEYVNVKFTKVTGYKSEEVIGLSPRILKSGKTLPEEYKQLWKTITSGKEWRGEFCNKRKNGELYWESEVISPLIGPKGGITHYIAVKEDVTERKRAEEQMKASLKEKETLLSEVHHRVKNNLQIISSLLNLQAENIEDKKTIAILKVGQDRIKSMVLVHEELYQEQNFARINFDNYVRTLTSRLLCSYGIGTESVSLKIDINNISLGLDAAIPCGLIINELVSNSLKYAFPGSEKGDINVSMCRMGKSKSVIELIVSDNGVGLPENIDFQKLKTLGLDLVKGLIEQIDGTITLNRIGGTEFKIVFEV